MPKKPSSAGSSVTAVAIVKSTVTVAAMPTPLRNDTPRMSSPSSATQTVAPANRTARPDVLSARSTACSTGRPALMALRWRVTMNSA